MGDAVTFLSVVLIDVRATDQPARTQAQSSLSDSDIHTRHAPKTNTLCQAPTYLVLVPFVRQIVPIVDMAGRTLHIDPPPGLFPPFCLFMSK